MSPGELVSKQSFMRNQECMVKRNSYSWFRKGKGAQREIVRGNWCPGGMSDDGEIVLRGKWC